MSSLSKQKKSSKELNIKQCDDQITSLPNSLITKILSSIPTKDAVATSVLSTKWKRSWMSISNLDFDDTLSKCSYKADENAHKVRKFTEFVTRVLLLRERSSLQRVRLKCYRDHDDPYVNAWLTTIIQCNVQELDVVISIPDAYPLVRLPSDIFLSRTLMVLKLSMDFTYVTIPNSAGLSGLKTLHLNGLCLRDDELITNLISSCPVLEELSLCYSLEVDVRRVKIIAHVLKTLIVKSYDYGYELVLDTPSLEYFDFEDGLAEVYLVNNMAHLCKAVINFSCCEEDYMDEFGEWPSGTVSNFLKGVSQVKKLFLSEGSVEVLSLCNLVLPKFSNLTYLKFEAGSGWNVLQNLLENSPSLESLYLEAVHDTFNEIHPVPFWDVPSCFLSHLKEIEIGYIENDEDHMARVEYILKNAKILEKLTLHYEIRTDDTVRNHAEFFKKLLSFPRASAICKVVICDS